MGGASDEGDAAGRADGTSTSQSTSAPQPDFARDLGVIEAITVVTRSCPNGGVIRAAERALAAIKEGGPDALREQAYFVLMSIQGWRGDRARQVHRSLSRYLERTPKTQNEPDPRP